MPTQQVDPTSGELLQEVANALLKSRKVIVITGAGISTNSGIPDFRSENGLYSLIQAQLDAAERRERKAASQDGESSESASEDEGGSSSSHDDQPDTQDTSLSSDDSGNDHESERASKRRRTSREGSIHVTPKKQQNHCDDEDALILPPLRPFEGTTPLRAEFQYTAQVQATSPLSSPPADFRSSAYRPRQFDFLRGSSPFSSSASSSPTPSRRSSISDSGSEVEGPSISRKLPNMKGKDLFDASIWADPLRTKVFYTFTTTLRQKSRDCVPTKSHHFISHLKTRGKLQRCYTQNIDRIEEKVGLSTELLDGPGKTQFRKSASNASQLAMMADESQKSPPSSQLSSNQPSASQPTLSSQPSSEGDTSKSSGVECVYLHGSLEHLRCFQCKRNSSWDEMEEQTMSGEQPACPHCTKATEDREEKGKRALGVGKLRPDIVLYGEEHPSSHLIGPLVEHDIRKGSNVLLILGTSLKVHGLKFLVREFANAIHNKNGKVIFVNFTKPPESIWSDIIDYWVQWDCDAWVTDLQQRVPQLWDAPQPPKKKPPPVNPAAFRDCSKATGAFWTNQIQRDLFRITGRPLPPKAKQEAVVVAQPVVEETSFVAVATEITAIRSSPVGMTVDTEGEVKTEDQVKPRSKGKAQPKTTKGQPRRARKSAPAVIQQPTPQPSSSPSSSQVPSSPKTAASSPPPSEDSRRQLSSFGSVKENPRIRKRKKVFEGGEFELPKVNDRRPTLAPIVNAQQPAPSGPDLRPQPMEPPSPPSGPDQAILSNFRSNFGRYWNNVVQPVNRFLGTYSYSWYGPGTGFGGDMIGTTNGPYHFKGGFHPSSQVAPVEVSKVEAQRHDAGERDAALIMTEMRATTELRSLRSKRQLPR